MTDATEFPQDFQECVRFHGHICPGLALGYVAAKAGLAALDAKRSDDEEFIAIVENDSCAVDAVQVLTGCTYGKGNLFFRDYGKQVYTFALRDSGKAVRVSLKPSADTHGDMSRDERIRFLLSQEPTHVFEVRQAQMDLPHEAQVHSSVVCEACGEKVMATRIRNVAGRQLCIPCAEQADAAR